ncbi:hypothetical protein Llan_2053 [Legionella lansingensis]|uniref:Uncharacterized protein n=2 Tax=Legionella lansingensis TaxID=45067 RepID=A0A0W0VJC6_9GAMM|nr:hypothetical protein Llan_2053 [Legionella lansingensis]
MSDNIFIEIENYLIHPTKTSAQRIKKLSNSLFNEVFREVLIQQIQKIRGKIEQIPLEQSSGDYKKTVAEKLHGIPGPKEPDDHSNASYKKAVLTKLREIEETVGNSHEAIKDILLATALNNLVKGDEWSPHLAERIEEEAAAAFPLSNRLVANLSLSKEDEEFDAPYIFKVTENQQKKIKSLLNEMFAEVRETKLAPHALTFAFGRYIERRRGSKFRYCDTREAVIRDNNTLLGLKGVELKEHGYEDVANALEQTAYLAINERCKAASHGFLSNEIEEISGILLNASQSEIIQTHRGAKQVIVNFLIALTGLGLLYLGYTAKDRGSFWYRPCTNTENKLQKFAKEAQATVDLADKEEDDERTPLLS